ncbi:hypothetical protein ACVIGV_006631 [Rhizobium leguminosarum]
MRPDFLLNVLTELQMRNWQPADHDHVIGRKAGTTVPYAVGARAAVTALNPAVCRTGRRRFTLNRWAANEQLKICGRRSGQHWAISGRVNQPLAFTSTGWLR